MNRRTGKIARFPKDLRELVNHMLDDGAQYTSIIHELQKHRHRWPDHVDELTVNNLSTWHAGGYQDWVRQQEMSADLATRQEFMADLLHGPDPNKLQNHSPSRHRPDLSPYRWPEPRRHRRNEYQTTGRLRPTNNPQPTKRPNNFEHNYQ